MIINSDESFLFYICLHFYATKIGGVYFYIP